MSAIDTLKAALTRDLSDGVIVDSEWTSAHQVGLGEAAATDAEGLKALFASPLLNAANAVVVPSVLEKIEKKLVMYGIKSEAFDRLKQRAAGQQRLADEVWTIVKAEPARWGELFDTKIHPQWGTIGVGALQLFMRRSIDEKVGIDATALQFMGEALLPSGLNQALFTETQPLKIKASKAPAAAAAVDPAAEARRAAEAKRRAAAARRRREQEEARKAKEARKLRDQQGAGAPGAAPPPPPPAKKPEGPNPDDFLGGGN